MDRWYVRLSDVPDAGKRVDLVLQEEEIRPKGTAAFHVESIHVSGLMEAAGTEFLFRGQVQGVYERPCDRCLESVQHVFSSDVTWLFDAQGHTIPDATEKTETVEEEMDIPAEAPGSKQMRKLDSLPEEDVFQEGMANLKPLIWEEIVLGYPSKVVCSESCAGLCPVCGKNLNQGACSCDKEKRTTEKTVNRGLAGLADLFPDLRPPRKEE